MFLPAPDESIWVGVLRLSVRVPGSRSLKDKRRVIRQLCDRLRNRQHLSVAEVGHREDHGRAVLAATMVSSDARLIQSTLDKAVHQIEQTSPAILDHRTIEIFRPWGSEGHDEDADASWR